MHRSYGLNTPRSQDYVRQVDERLSNLSASEIASRVRDTVQEHDRWRDECAISLNAAENVLSRRCRELLNSDLATRVTEGFPGDKDFPADRQNRFIDEIEATMISMLRRMFGAKHVEWRPVSTSMANATVFMSLTQPGDILLSQPEAGGGNYSYNEKGPPRAARLDVRPLAMLADSFEIDTKRAVDQIAANRPKLVVVGGSNVLFPYPVEALSEAARQVGAKLLYDAAHVALFIGCGMFQDPFREGADLMTFSSHKIMSGPVGGVILMNDDEIASKVLPYSFPTLVQTRDQNKFASSAHALAEMAAFGADYASQMHHNAVALANSLQSEGLEVLCADRNFTQTHQIFVLIADEEALQVEQSCQQANLLVTRAQRMEAVGRAGLRLTTQEITRRGMSAHDMPVIARWLRRLITNREAPSTIAAEIQEFLKDFRTIKFSFDDFPQQSRGYS